MSAATNVRESMRKGKPREAGQSLAEFALVVVILMALLLAIVDFSRIVYARNVVASAAREGARYAIMDPSNTAGIEQAAKALVAGVDVRELSVTVTQPDSLHVRVEVTYTFRPLSSLVAGYLGGSGGAVTLRGRSMMRVE